MKRLRADRYVHNLTGSRRINRRICRELANLYPDIYYRVLTLLLTDGFYGERYCEEKARMSLRAAFPEKYRELWSKYHDDPPTDELPIDV